MSVVEAPAASLRAELEATAETAASATREQRLVGVVVLTLAAAQLIWLAVVGYLAYLSF